MRISLEELHRDSYKLVRNTGTKGKGYIMNLYMTVYTDIRKITSMDIRGLPGARAESKTKVQDKTQACKNI